MVIPTGEEKGKSQIQDISPLQGTSIFDLDNKMEEIQITDKIIKQLQPHVPRFAGDKNSFLEFFSIVVSKLDNRSFSDNVKVESVKFFLDGIANVQAETYTSSGVTWEDFKQYLLNRYVSDKNTELMKLKRDLDNLTMGEGGTVNYLYNRILRFTRLVHLLDPLSDYTTDKYVIQKLLSSIPQEMYLEIKTPIPDDIKILLPELERLEQLHMSLVANVNSKKNATVRSLEVGDPEVDWESDYDGATSTPRLGFYEDSRYNTLPDQMAMQSGDAPHDMYGWQTPGDDILYNKPSGGYDCRNNSRG